MCRWMLFLWCWWLSNCQLCKSDCYVCHICLVILKLQPVKILTGLIEVFNLISVVSFWQQYRPTIVSCQCFAEAGAQCWWGGEPALSHQPSSWSSSPWWWRWRGGGGTWGKKLGRLWPRRGRLKKTVCQVLLLPPFSRSLTTSYWECSGSCSFLSKNSDWAVSAEMSKCKM